MKPRKDKGRVFAAVAGEVHKLSRQRYLIDAAIHLCGADQLQIVRLRADWRNFVMMAPSCAGQVRRMMLNLRRDFTACLFCLPRIA